MDRAVELLLRGERELSRLAADLGYCDQSHFTRDFKRTTGQPPGSFRRAVNRLAH